jgi:hypothetical protein
MQSNQEKLTNWFNALQSKASASIATAFANSRTKDSRLIIEGKSKLTGVWVGSQEFIDMIMLAKSISHSSISTTLFSCVANETDGMAVVHLKGNRENITVDQPIIYLFKFDSQGLIFETRLVPTNQKKYDQFFS